VKDTVVFDSNRTVPDKYGRGVGGNAQFPERSTLVSNRFAARAATGASSRSCNRVHPKSEISWWQKTAHPHNVGHAWHFAHRVEGCTWWLRSTEFPSRYCFKFSTAEPPPSPPFFFPIAPEVDRNVRMCLFVELLNPNEIKSDKGAWSRLGVHSSMHCHLEQHVMRSSV
jgi:hypothetical protein